MTKESKSNLMYQVHVGYDGWLEHARNGVIVGNRGDRKTVQALKVWIDEKNMDVTYNVYYPDEGWSQEVSSGEMAGSTGKGKEIYGVCLSLKNTCPSLEDEADIQKHLFYRVRGVGTFWSDWKKDGEKLYSDETPIEAIQIYLGDEEDISAVVMYMSDDEREATPSYESIDNIILKKNKKSIMYTSVPYVKFREVKNSFFSNFNELENLARTHGTDKNSRSHNFTRKYDFFLKPYRDKEITILELGVFRGASIKMWGDYFAKGHVIGVDIDEACKQYEGENRKILIQDLSNIGNLRNLVDLHPMVVVDDASHIWSHQIKALFILLPAVQPGGIYILEDLETSFSMGRDKGYADAYVSAYEILAAVAEVVTSNERLDCNGKNLMVVRMADKIEELAMQIEMMSFIHGSCIMVKK